MTIQFERDLISSPERHQAHHHAPLLVHTSGEEDPLDLAIASKAPVPTITEADVANFVNSVSLPSKGLEEAKRKRSESTDLATSDLEKRARTQSAHSAVATDAINAPSQVDMGKLNRPPPQLCTGKPSLPVNQKDIFDIVSEPETELPKQASKEPKKRGKPPKNKELSTMLATMPQTSALNEPDIAATSVAPPLHAQRGRPSKSPDLHPQGGQQEHPGRYPRNGVKKSAPSRQPEGRQTRSQKQVPASSSRISPRPAHKPEDARSQSADQDGLVQESQPPSHGEALDDGPSPGKTKRGTPGNPEPELPRQDLCKDGNISRVRTGSEASAQQLENDHEEGDPIGNASGDEDKKHDGDHEEDRNPESDEQEDIGQEPAEPEGNVQENVDQAAHDSEMASDGPELNLLGQDGVWSEIKEARREIRPSRIKNHAVREIPKLQTDEGKRIVRIIKAAEQAYNSADQNKSRVQPQQALQNLTRCIEDISEDSCSDESGVIQDICAHAIPEMVLLLDKAFGVRTTQLSQRKDTRTLEEIIGLQEALMMLCQKAREWKAKPETSSPIIKPTRTIFRSIKTMRNAFIEELQDRKRLRKMRANRANQTRKIDEASIQREREKRKREDLAILQRIEDDCNQGHATWWREDLAQVYEPDARAANVQPTTAQCATARSAATNQEAVEKWSEKQEKALLKELVRKKNWNLTGKTCVH